MILPATPTARMCDWIQHVKQNLKTWLHCHVPRWPLTVTDLPPVQNSATTECKKVSPDNEMMHISLDFIENVVQLCLLPWMNGTWATIVLRGCDSDPSSSCMCLAGTCLSSCQNWRDLEAAVLRQRREEVSCSRSNDALFNISSAAFSNFLTPVPGLGYWRYWLPPPSGHFQTLLFSAGHVQWALVHSSPGANVSGRVQVEYKVRLKRSSGSKLPPLVIEAVFRCCAFTKQQFCKVTSLFP